MPLLLVKLSAVKTKALEEAAEQAGYSPEEYARALIFDAIAPKKSTVTLKTVAKAAGVSVMAVSFALNGKTDQLGVDTYKLILRTAKKLGYQRNVTARNLRRKRS